MGGENEFERCEIKVKIKMKIGFYIINLLTDINNLEYKLFIGTL